MRAHWLIAAVGCSSSAAAPAASSPDIPACITRDRIELFAAGADPVVCGSTWSECAKHPLAGQGSGNDACCIQLDAKSTPTHVASPLPVRDPAAAVLHNDQVCLGTACTPIGAKLTTEIAAAQASSKPDDSTAFALSATADLKVVVVRHPNQGGTAWSVHADAPLALDPPPAYRNSNGPPPDVTAVGNVLVADWFDCAGPCHVMQVVGGNGKNVGKPVTGYLQLRWISDKVFALLENSIVIEGKPPPKDHFRLFDLRTGKPRGDVPIDPASAGSTVPLDRDRVAVVVDNGSGRDVPIELVDVANPDKPRRAGRLALPACP